MIISSLILYLSYAVGFAFTTICLACGLYYIAEWVEEYSMWTKRVIRYMIMSVIGLHVLCFLFEDFPFLYLLLGIGAHIVYFLLLRDFPFFEFTNPIFILACVCAVGDHIAWFYYFTYNIYHDFPLVASFFLIMVWLVPFAYFISLSANESTLPYGIVSSTGEEVTADDFSYAVGSRKRGKKASFFLVLLTYLKRKKENLLPSVTGTTNQKLF